MTIKGNTWMADGTDSSEGKTVYYSFTS